MNKIASVCLLVLAVCQAIPGPMKRATGCVRSSDECVGKLVETDHSVTGTVYIRDQNTLVIDDFRYDANGFGVYINVSNKKRNHALAKNRINVPYPTGSQGEPIEIGFENGGGCLVIDLKQLEGTQDVKSLGLNKIKADDITWLSVWCTVFNLDFGHTVGFTDASQRQC